MRTNLRACLMVTVLTWLAPVVAAEPIHHLVLIWLKPDLGTEVREQLIARSQALGRIPGVSGFSIGSVLASERPIVDDSFDVAITMVFSSSAAMETYIDSAEHKRIVSQHIGPLAEKIVVYDYRAVAPPAE